MKKYIAWVLTASLLLGAAGGAPALASDLFRTNLENLRPLQGTWNETETGLRGVGSGDCFAMSDTTADNFSYQANVRLNGDGAAALVFRSSADGSQAYVANVDRSRGDARLFKFPATGGFELGAFPIDKSVTDYTLRVEAVDSTIRFYLNGTLAIEATDDSYQTGRLGLLIWSNDAVFQDVQTESLSTLPPLPEDAPIRISCVGDSITYGEFCNYGHRDTQSYPAQLQALLGDRYLVQNFGYNGASMMKNAAIPYVDQSVYRFSLHSRPDVVLLMLGTNDASNDAVNHGNPDLLDAHYKADAIELVRTYQSLPGAPTVYIATSPACYRTDDPNQPTLIRDKIVPMQKEIAAETGCTVLDIHAATTDSAALFPDNLHPNRQGYSILAGVFCAGIVTQAPTTAVQIALAKAYATAEKRSRTGRGVYTEESFSALLTALEVTRARFLQLNTLSDAQITAQIEALDSAVDRLTEVELPEGQILHYDFNTIKDGVVKDSVSGLDAQIVGRVVPADGFDDGAADFKGGANDYLLLPRGTFAQTRNITITAWVKLRRNSIWSVFLVAGDDPSDCMSYATRGDGFGLTCGFNNSETGEQRVRTTTANAVPISRWAHLVYTQAGATAKLYLNGKQIGTQTLSMRPVDLLADAEIRLGASHLFPSDPSLSGLMEDFAIYNRSMDAAEIRALYDAGVARQNVISTVIAPEPLGCAYGTAFARLGLPESCAVVLRSGTRTTCPVVWDSTGYSPTTAGAQTIQGTLNPTAPMQNPEGQTVSVTVTVGDPPQTPDKPSTPQKPAPQNGIATVGGKAVLYKNGKVVTGTTLAKVGKVTYAVKKGIVQKASKKAGFKLVKLGKKSYIVNTKGAVQKSKSAKTGKLVKVGKKRYIVNKKGVVQTAKKKYLLVKAGKRKYIVNKSGVVQVNKKKLKIGKVVYKTDKTGAAKKRT